jgi:hypothetical protein
MARDPRVRFVRSAAAALIFAAGHWGGVALAYADGPPAASLVRARTTAKDVMGVFVARLPAETKQRLVGAYVAFDESATDVNALAACDDDGDYVVVLSDALLNLASTVAQAQATDEIFGTHKLDEYAALLAGSQRQGVRPLPPPAGFFDASQSRSPARVALEAVRFREIVGGVVAHELAHLVQGDLVCPNPTATHESGDDQWTREEREHALAVALKIYAPLRVLAADGAATSRILDAGLTEQGDLAWLSVVDRLESARADAVSTYLSLHHDGGVRAEVVRAAADQWRRVHAAAGPRTPPGNTPGPRALSPPMSADR